jgi:hypothetical protein
MPFPTAAAFGTAPAEPLPSGVVAFGCSEGQEAFEDDDLRHGVFFHYVLEGLRGKAALPDRASPCEHCAITSRSR